MTFEKDEPSTQETWYRVADVVDLIDGGVKAVIAAGKPLVLACVGGRYGALDGRCPHAGGPLAEGLLEDGLLVCPWHGRQYNPFDGQCEGYASVRAYKVEVRPDGIYVAV
jgi:pyruvate oxidase